MTQFIGLYYFFIFLSTIQNILLRYGINNHLNFILPPKEYQNQLFSDDPAFSGRRAQSFTVSKESFTFMKSIISFNLKDSYHLKLYYFNRFQGKLLKRVPWHVDLKKSKSYDIMALHSIWNHDEIR